MTSGARFITLSLSLLLLLALPAAVFGCSCAGERPVCEAFGGASAVFVGRVVGSAERKVYEDQQGEKTTFDVGTIYFEVEEAFSGVKGKKRVEIHSGTGGGDCGYWFIRGRRYLVYAHESSEDKKLYTSICSRTRFAENAAEDLAYLRALPPEGSGARIYGMVAKPLAGYEEDGQRKVEGLAGIKVTLTDAKGKRRELVTDAEGKYELTGLRAGEYEVKAELPSYYDQENLNDKLRVADRGCAAAYFAAVANGRIAGHLIDTEGRPVTKGKITLFKADDADTTSRRTEVGLDYIDDPQGTFEIGDVPPGEYVLGINLSASPDAESPYPPTYYPGVTSRAEASVIKLGLGEQRRDLTLRLPPRLVERTVQGIVVWADGSPAVGAEVYLMDVNHPGYTTTGWDNKTDAVGRFQLSGFDGLTYWVHASAPKYPDRPYSESGMTHAEPAKVTLAQDVFGVKLVLTSEGEVCEHYLTKRP